MSNDSTERVQAALAIFARLLSARTDEERVRLGTELEGVGLTPAELEDVQALYFQGRDAERPLRAENGAKMAFLVQHVPGSPSIEAAIGRLSDEQLREYNALTADDL